MDDITNIIVAAPPEFLEAASHTGYPLAYMVYRIGRGHHLFRAQGVKFVSGGVMVLDTGGYVGGGPSATLILEILGECEKNKFSGIVLDTGGKLTSQLMLLIGHLASEAKKRGLKVYVHEILSNASPHVVVLVPTALSGGTLSGHLSDAIEKYGHSRVALEVERIRMDFSLPATQGTGRALTDEELRSLIDEHHPQSFLSKDLCAYYFTYRDKKGIHFVLYDNGASIRRKLTVGGKLGIEDAFIFYPHAADIIDKIIGQSS
ncbi:MAG: hypothetical protein GX847_02310 [Clostridiales bacterium]|nr:hypothetical protein [Clostridiales bacterium]